MGNRKLLNYACGVILLGVIIYLKSKGIDLTPLWVGMGAASVIVGIALQEPLSSLFKGVALDMEGVFHRGEWIRVGGEGGLFGHHRQPGLDLAEAAVRHVRVPRDRRAAAVAALELGPETLAVGVLQFLEGDIGLGQAQLLALIQTGRAAQRQQQRRQDSQRDPGNR